LMDTSDNLDWKLLSVPNDGLLRPFKAQFPFSFVVCKLIDRLRSTTDLYNEETPKSLSLAIDLAVPGLNNLPKEYLWNYLYDYIAIHGYHGYICNSLDEEQQFLITKTLIETVADCKTLCDIQITYWKEEKRLFTYFSLFDIIPEVAKTYLKVINNNNFKSASEMDIILFEVLCEVLDPYRQKTTQIQWLRQLT